VRVRFQKLGLTVREADVLFWMTEGKQNPEIAIILGLSLGTVQEHVGNLVRKLGQENRHAATVFALRSIA
jgi:DNA-binding CsgD family transcriptional regulator